jgi:hypothetical protein
MIAPTPQIARERPVIIEQDSHLLKTLRAVVYPPNTKYDKKRFRGFTKSKTYRNTSAAMGGWDYQCALCTCLL